MAKKKDIKTAKEQNEVDVSSAENLKKQTSAKQGKRAKQKSKSKKVNLEEKIIELQNEKEELNDKFLRLYSEFDNYRKRTIKEKIELAKAGGKVVILELLPVIDDFERALQSFEEAEEVDAVKQGVELIYNKYISILKKLGLELIKSNGLPFDTDEHAAITNIPVEDEQMKGKIVDTTEKGYKLNGKVIRYAKVVVGN